MVIIKEKKGIRLLLSTIKEDTGIRYYVAFAHKNIYTLHFLYGFDNFSSCILSDFLIKMEEIANKLFLYTFIVIDNNEEETEESQHFVTEVYNLLVDNGNDVLLEEN